MRKESRVRVCCLDFWLLVLVCSQGMRYMRLWDFVVEEIVVALRDGREPAVIRFIEVESCFGSRERKKRRYESRER